MHPPSNPNKTVDKDGYRASFYPGFVSRLAVRKDGIETELYAQSEIFYLPPGYVKPWPTSTVEFSGPDGRRIVLQVEDPHQQIGRIEVHLKGPYAPTTNPDLVKLIPGASDMLQKTGISLSGEVDEGGGGMVLVMEDGPVLCPPVCPQ